MENAKILLIIFSAYESNRSGFSILSLCHQSFSFCPRYQSYFAKSHLDLLGHFESKTTKLIRRIVKYFIQALLKLVL